MKEEERRPGNGAKVPVGDKGQMERETRQQDSGPFALPVSSGEAALWPGQGDMGQVPGSGAPGGR